MRRHVLNMKMKFHGNLALLSLNLLVIFEALVNE